MGNQVRIGNEACGRYVDHKISSKDSLGSGNHTGRVHLYWGLGREDYLQKDQGTFNKVTYKILFLLSFA